MFLAGAAPGGPDDPSGIHPEIALVVVMAIVLERFVSRGLMLGALKG